MTSADRNEKIQDVSLLTAGEVSSPLFSKRDLSVTEEAKAEVFCTSEERADEIYEELGGCGCFQIMAYFAVCFGMSAPSWFFY